MQLVLSNNRVIAHGENFLPMGGVVINTETGAKYENATISECDGCPSDIDKVGYEYRNGVFVPCAPYGVGNNNGFFMEVCESCATPRSSGIPIKGGIGRENMSIFPLLWENASPGSSFDAQTIPLEVPNYAGFVVIAKNYRLKEEEKLMQSLIGSSIGKDATFYCRLPRSEDLSETLYSRGMTIVEKGIDFAKCKNGSNETNNARIIPLRIYGVKL